MPTVRNLARKKLKAAVKKIVFMKSSEDLEITVGETQLTYKERFEKGHKVRNTQHLVGTEGSWELPWFPWQCCHPHQQLQLSPPGRQRQELHDPSC